MCFLSWSQLIPLCPACPPHLLPQDRRSVNLYGMPSLSNSAASLQAVSLVLEPPPPGAGAATGTGTPPPEAMEGEGGARAAVADRHSGDGPSAGAGAAPCCDARGSSIGSSCRPRGWRSGAKRRDARSSYRGCVGGDGGRGASCAEPQAQRPSAPRCGGGPAARCQGEQGHARAWSW